MAGYLIGTEPFGFNEKFLVEAQRLVFEFSNVDLHTHLSPQGTGSIAKVSL